MPKREIPEKLEENQKCTNCNHENPADKEWCGSCGLALKHTETAEEAGNENENHKTLAFSWRTFGASFKGKRKNNEDALLIVCTETFQNNTHNKEFLLAVADGMGGLEHGEKASQLAIDTLARNHPKEIFYLKVSIETANKRIFELARELEQEIGSTIIAAILSEEGATIAWAGDSPLFHIRENKIIYRTKDHNLFNDLISQGMSPDEANTHPEKSTITKSLGVKGLIHPEAHKISAEPGDCILLCSDGVSGFLTESEICEIINENPNVEDACNSLLRKALNNGSNDNLTAIVAKYENDFQDWKK